MLIYFQLPTYARITGISCVGIPRSVDEIFLARVFSSYQEAIAGNLNLLLGEYILENYLELEQELYSLVEKLRERMLSNLDFKECKAEFNIISSKDEILEVLNGKEDFCFEEETEGGVHYAWVRQGRSKKYEELHPTAIQSKDGADSVGWLGKLVLQDKKLILINFGKAQYDFCREMLDRYFGNRIEFSEEIIVDQNEMLKTGEHFSVTDELLSSQKNSEEIPQEIKVQIIENFYRQNYEKFLTDPIPALSNKTPLQAAKDKKMKPALIELMKDHINSIERNNKQEGTNVQLDWVLERLGLKGKI